MRKKLVLINTKSDKAFRGILWSMNFGLIVLKRAELLKETGETILLDGELVLFKKDVDFMQVLP